MMKINLLKAHMALKGKSINEIVDLLGISKSTIYRKLKGKSEFTRKEMLLLINFLNIGNEEAANIFFDD
ncbi:helix-turn-helix transcriptional regulator [Clostridium botulinum]|nr:XRE family transcriptional regulator [Clostridium botulinum]MBN1056129.1 XRE family transcriptional regulator [Clostridium botulinum]NFI54954.1 helix-turn-helix transcriptional regulator [Clostridium botulinum]NFJ50737.1 helix-turn-helix transcriptional regulator [Clostridium botulinum]NFL07878.1 helix-turn-helix transcriptional regulator [Clostridium botulinum]